VGSFHAGDKIYTAPLVDAGSVYVASVNGKLFKLDAATLEPAWDAPFQASGGLLTDPVLADKDTVLVGGIGHRLYAVNAATGQEEWSLSAGNWFWGTPLVHRDTVYAPNLDGRVYAVDAATGARKWEFGLGAPVRSSPVVLDGLLIVIGRSGRAWGLATADGNVSEVWGPVEIEGTVLSNPLPLDDRVLIVEQGGDLHEITAEGSLRQVQVAE
jgi:outer membrane protein assembly factor BamB